MRQGRHDGRVGVSVSPDAVQVLDEVRDELTKQLGFAPSYAQTILHICREYQKMKATPDNIPKTTEQTDNEVEMFQDNQGDSNE